MANESQINFLIKVGQISSIFISPVLYTLEGTIKEK